MKIKRNWRYLYINCVSAINYFFIKSSTAKKKLINEIQNNFEFRLNISLFKSGRTSIYAILIELKKKGYTDIFVPFRLCNVVEVAAKGAKMNVFFYKNDEDFFIEHQKEKFDENKTVLLLATYFNENIDKKNILSAFIKQFGENAPVIFDECQSLFQFNLFRENLHHRNKFLVISFNDKFIPGVMGGAVVSSEKINFTPHKLELKNELFYLAILFKSSIDFIKPLKQSNIKGEFSVCKGFRYDIKNDEISKISSVVALNFLKYKKQIYEQLNRNHSSLNNYYCQVNNNIKIFYLFSSDSISSKKLLKGPYLCDADESMKEAIEDTGGVFHINSYKYKLLQ